MSRQCKRCGSGVAELCQGCWAEREARLVGQVEQLLDEVRYLRTRCAEELVVVRSELDWSLGGSYFPAGLGRSLEPREVAAHGV